MAPGVIRRVMAAILGAAVLCGAASAADTVYVKLKVNEKTSFLVAVRGDELRIAPSADQIATTPALQGKPGPNSSLEFPAAPLTLPPGTLPEDVTALKVQVTSSSGPGRAPIVSATAFTCMKDKAGAEWAYGDMRGEQGSFDAGRAPVIETLISRKVDFQMAADSKQPKTIGIGMRALNSKDSFLDFIQKDGKEVLGTVRVLEADGKEVSSAAKAIRDLGFS